MLSDYILISHQGITLQSTSAVSNAKRLGWPLTEVGEALYLIHAPGGYPFYLVDKEVPSSGECRDLFSVFIYFFENSGNILTYKTLVSNDCLCF